MHVAHSTKSHRQHDSCVASQSQLRRDARAARRSRTRDAIADAANQLIHEGNHAPTIADVARRAQVGIRTVFHHFDDIDGLYMEVIRRSEPAIARCIVALDPHAPLDTRVRQLVAQRCALYARIAPLRKAMRARAGTCDSPAIRDASRRLQFALAHHASHTFAPELKGRADRFGTLERIAALTSYELWDHLVRVQKLSATKVRKHMVISVLREFT